MTTLLLYSSLGKASQAVDALTSGGVTQDEIGIITLEKNYSGSDVDNLPDSNDDGRAAGEGIVSGGISGAVLGALAAAVSLAIPGAGPILIAGPLVSALGVTGASAAVGGALGAAVGGVSGLVESLTKAGIEETKAQEMQNAVQSGGAIVSVNGRSEDEVSGLIADQKPDDIAQIP